MAEVQSPGRPKCLKCGGNIVSLSSSEKPKSPHRRRETTLGISRVKQTAPVITKVPHAHGQQYHREQVHFLHHPSEAPRMYPKIRRPKTPPPIRNYRPPPGPSVKRVPSDTTGVSRHRRHHGYTGNPHYLEDLGEDPDRICKSGRIAIEFETRFVLSRRRSQSDNSLDRSFDTDENDNERTSLDDMDYSDGEDYPMYPVDYPSPCGLPNCNISNSNSRGNPHKIRVDVMCNQGTSATHRNRTRADQRTDHRITSPHSPSKSPQSPTKVPCPKKQTCCGAKPSVQYLHVAPEGQPVYSKVSKHRSKSTSPASTPAKCPPTLFIDTPAENEMGTTITTKPVIENVKLVKPDKTPKLNRKSNLSRSAEDLNRLNVLLDLSDVTYDYFLSKNLRSSFFEDTTLKRETVFFNSDVQTLLKHSRSGEEPIYSLPQPLSYGDDTLKAVKAITEKYDTFKRKQMHAMSFRDGDLLKLRSNYISRGNEKPRRNSTGQSPPTSPLGTPLGCPPTEEAEKVEEVYQSPKEIMAKDIARLEMFYRSQDSLTVVCECLADMFTGELIGKGAESVTEWKLVHTGIPVLILNTGEGHRKRELFIVLADRDTGFPLWQDKINYLTNYSVNSPVEHLLHFSSSLTKMAKLSLFSEDAAHSFHEKFLEMTSDPNDELWKVSTKSDKKKSKKTKRKKSFRKEDISQPCNFVHVTRIEPCNPTLVSSFGSYITEPPSPGVKPEIPEVDGEDDGNDDFRPRCPTR